MNVVCDGSTNYSTFKRLRTKSLSGLWSNQRRSDIEPQRLMRPILKVWLEMVLVCYNRQS